MKGWTQEEARRGNAGQSLEMGSGPAACNYEEDVAGERREQRLDECDPGEDGIYPRAGRIGLHPGEELLYHLLHLRRLAIDSAASPMPFPRSPRELVVVPLTHTRTSGMHRIPASLPIILSL